MNNDFLVKIFGGKMYLKYNFPFILIFSIFFIFESNLVNSSKEIDPHIIIDLRELKASAKQIRKKTNYKLEYNELAEDSNAFIDYLIQLIYTEDINKRDKNRIKKILNSLKFKIESTNLKIYQEESKMHSHSPPEAQNMGAISTITVGIIYQITITVNDVIKLYRKSKNFERKAKEHLISSLKSQKWSKVN